MSESVSSLYWACYRGKRGSVLQLTNFKSVRYVDPDIGDTPLHQACRQGWLDIVKLLIEEYGCDPVTSKCQRQSPLHYACRYGHIYVVEYLVKKQHSNPLLKDNINLEPLDHALNNNKTDIAVYICQHCISSDEALNPYRIETTINLIKCILRADPSHPKWKTANGDNILQIVGSSKSCISRMSSAVVLEILITGTTNNIQPDWRTGDGDTLLELACQSDTYLSQISSASILKWLEDVTIYQVKVSIPDSKTADGEILSQLVCQSEMCISHISTEVLSKWLSDTTLELGEIIVMPEWKTADGDSLLQLVCQSETCLSRISSAALLKWLHITTLYPVNISIPDSKTADGDTLIQLVCQSEKNVSQISSAVLSKWLRDTTLDVNFAEAILPEWKTADGDTLLQLICQSETCLSQISSAVLLKWLHIAPLDQEKISIPDSKTADGNTLLQLVCQSETNISLISSAVLLKWLRDTSADINLAKVIIPEWKTADGDTLLQLVCQSETCLSRISSALLSMWLRDTILNIAEIIIPELKTADGDTVLQLVCQSQTCLSRISSKVLFKWLCVTSLNHVNISIPDSKTADGETLLKLVCQSRATVSQISSAVLSKWLRDTILRIDLEELIIPDWKTADGDTLLQLVCQSEKCLSQMSSATLSTWIRIFALYHVNISLPDSKTADGDTLLQLVFQSEKTVKRISSAVMSKWLRDTTLNVDLAKIIIPEWKTADDDTLLLLVCQSETCLSQISSAILLNWLHINPLYHVNISLPDSQTADGDTLLQLVCQSETTVSRISSVVLSMWLSDTSLITNLAEIITPKWKTADDETLLHLVCQFEMIVSRIPSAILSKWLSDTTLDINFVNIIAPGCKTADGDTLLQLVCQSKTCLSQISSAALLRWLCITTLYSVNISIPDSKTADGDTLLLLVFQSETTVSRISSVVLSKWLRDTTVNIYLAKIIIPEWKTADGDTLLQLVCQSETCLSRIYSAVLLKWLSDTTLDLMQIVIPYWKTADGDTLLQLICQSEICLSQISSAVFLKWSEKTHIKHVSISLPDCKTADNHSLLKLVLQSAICISKTSSTVLSKWLSDSSEITIDLMKKVDPNWKTLEGDRFFHAVCQSKIEDKKMIELMQDYLQQGCLNSDILDSNGNTALHIACRTDKPSLVSFLLNESRCDPSIKNKMENLPLDMTTNPEIINYLCQHDHVAVFSKTVVSWINNRFVDEAKMLHILQVLVDNHRYKTKDGSTLLHIITGTTLNDIFWDKEGMIHYLLTKCHSRSDPNCLDNKGQMPLQLTSDLRIMKMFVEHGAKMTMNVVFKVISSKHITDYGAIELFKLSTGKQTMLWNPDDLNSNNETALHLACKFDKPALVNYLLTEAKCDPNADNRLAESPLESTTNLKIAKMLIKHGARVTPELVLRFESMETQNKHTLIKLMLMTWNSDDRNSDGYTALHLACKAGNPTTVNLLLSVAHCDPNIKSDNEEVPLQMTTNSDIIKNLIRHGAKTSIMYESCQKTLGTNGPVKPPVKVFIVGNPSVGKSSLTAALKKKLSIVVRFFTSGKVSGVDQKTVGIVPHEVESDIYGRVTLYDFAGHREFYSGHAALLQTAIQSTPPVFLLVVNLYQGYDAITKDIMYWMSFLENQCASVNCKPHIILVGSHADFLKSSGTNAKDKIKAIVDSLDTKCFINMELVGFVAMDCQYHESSGMSDLRRLLNKSCNELRIHEPITFSAHCFLVYLIDTFTNSPAVTINTVYNDIENQSQTKGSILEFLPPNFEALYKICIELNDRGHILLLKDRVAIENSYIVIDKEFLLSKISGTVFAPEGFEQYKQLSTNTGVVPLSKLAMCFPDKDLNILIGFLTHLEFCHEISDQALHQLISEQYSQVSTGERYYLFPGLISVKADDTVWNSKLQSNYDYSFGWTIKCTDLEQFVSSRFLQVLLLRLAFSFALEETCESDDPNQSIGIHRNCYLWKNGIFWGSVFGMQTLVEVTSDNKSVALLTRFCKENFVRCIQHRSEVIGIILQCIKQFCPRVSTLESYVCSSSPLRYPLNLSCNAELNICTLQKLATAVVSDYVCPSVVLQCNTIPAKDFLSFEPYLEMKLSTIHELWDEKNDKEVMSERFLSRFAQQATDKLISFIKVFTGSSDSSISDDQLYQNLLKWRDGDANNKKTYRDLRQIIDQYSVFAGRNVLVSVIK